MAASGSSLEVSLKVVFILFYICFCYLFSFRDSLVNLCEIQCDHVV